MKNFRSFPRLSIQKSLQTPTHLGILKAFPNNLGYIGFKKGKKLISERYKQIEANKWAVNLEFFRDGFYSQVLPIQCEGNCYLSHRLKGDFSDFQLYLSMKGQEV